MIQDLIHQKIVRRLDAIEDWFRNTRAGLGFPFYSSFDVRDSSFKVAPVDANLFPAGFNNICRVDQESAVDIVSGYFADHYPDSYKKVLLLTEEHTNNPYYWDNVATLQRLMEQAGLTVRLGIPRHLPAPLILTSASGQQLRVHSAEREGETVRVDDFVADVIISNNDFSEEYADWHKGLTTAINPPHEMGWYRRRKDEFFFQYNKLVQEFCERIALDPWHLQVETERFENFDVNSNESRKDLAAACDKMIERLRVRYQQHGISDEPFLFVKNNAGTYGLGVTQVNSGQEVLDWNYKARKKMKAAKGGRTIEEVIIQEGIPTTVTAAGTTAEPVVYMIGCQLAGAFLRSHEQKGPKESLNSPGAVYKRLCVSDLKVSVEGHPMENVYGWVARLSFLAIAKEARAHHVEIKGYLGCGLKTRPR